MTELLWQPSQNRIDATLLAKFIATANAKHGLTLKTMADLWRWSVDHPGPFWRDVWERCGAIGDGPGAVEVDDPKRMPGAKWFPAAKLNYAENLLRHEGAGDALVFWGEDKVKKRVSHDQLRALVSRTAQAMKGLGIGVGDTVAGFMPNMPETIVATLAAASLGAVWSSASPDFGAQGALDRFGQIAPKLLISVDGYWYNGKRFDIREKLAAITKGLPTLKQIVIAPYLDEKPDLAPLPGAVTLDAFIAPYQPAALSFLRVPFDHPLFIMFSSGTTGVPKCIIHGVGGTTLQHLKEHQLHTDVRPGDRIFYFTTCGWMMWNWLISGLASGATLLLYDGSPGIRDGAIIFDYADAERMTMLGTSAKWIDAIAKAGLDPIRTHKLDTVRTLCSTGSVLAPEGFDYVYAHIKKDVCLSSISGGTDIISCFALGNPIGPVWRGELQARGLGMKVEVYGETGHAVTGEKGELVCTQAFPSQPVGFGNDPDGAKYKAAYFQRFPGIWTHGDYAELTEHGGMVIYGRSDATLNPGGVRIGTAEIYRQVETIDEVAEALVIGQDWDNDVRVVLFVRLKEGHQLDQALIDRIKKRIRDNTTPRHVPARVVQVADIPRTRSGKIVELAVRDVVHGRPVKNKEALANPEALDLYAGLKELQG